MSEREVNAKDESRGYFKLAKLVAARKRRAEEISGEPARVTAAQSSPGDAATHPDVVSLVSEGIYVSSAAAANRAAIDGSLAHTLGVRLVIQAAAGLEPPVLPATRAVTLPPFPLEAVAQPGPVEVANAAVNSYLESVRAAVAADSGADSPALFYLCIPLVDNGSQRLPPVLFAAAAAVVEWFHSERGAGVLLHCQMGVSRSVSLAAAWLLWATCAANASPPAPATTLLRHGGADLARWVAQRDANCTDVTPFPRLVAVLSHIQHGRPMADPNVWYRSQLLRFERTVDGGDGGAIIVSQFLRVLCGR